MEIPDSHLADEQLQRELMLTADAGHKEMLENSTLDADPAKVDHHPNHAVAIDGGKKLGDNHEEGEDLIASYDSSSEQVPARLPRLTRAAAARANNMHSITIQNDANRNVDGGTAATPKAPYYGVSPEELGDPLKAGSLLDSADSSADDYIPLDENSDWESDNESVSDDDPSWGCTKNTSSKPVKRDPNAPTLSKLQKRRQAYAEMGVELDSNGTKRGVTRGDPGKLEYLDNGTWVPAVYHHEIRDVLLKVTDSMGEYDEEPASGVNPLDRTAFKPKHKSVKLNIREQRPEILFQWNQTEEPPKGTPDRWYYGERLILDVDSRPLPKWPELPLTLSGQCEGLRLEYYKRLNHHISMNDLKARMPPTTCRRPGLKETAVKTPALANRMTRDRCRTGIKAWQARQGSRHIETRILQIMPEDIQRTVLQTNSTRCFRDLTAAELEYVEAANEGQAENLAKAGTRLLDEETRRERAQRKVQGRSGKNGAGVKIHSIIDKATQDQLPLIPGSAGTTSVPSTSQAHFSNGRKRSTSLIQDAVPKRHKRLSEQMTSSDIDSKTEEQGDGMPSKHHDMNASGELSPKSISPLDPRDDFRNKKPSTPLEQCIVQMALNLSRDDYERYVGEEAPSTDRTASYEAQLVDIIIARGLRIGIHVKLPDLKSWGPARSFEELHAMALAREKPGRVTVKGSQRIEGQGNSLGDMEGDTLVG
ncbi:MAG: hypothetical protein L6R35_005976 [Caloplaca aegaea]|nr:MAG: hypothetical protein L6R35_005976 [Caloplaca aegaea]